MKQSILAIPNRIHLAGNISITFIPIGRFLLFFFIEMAFKEESDASVNVKCSIFDLLLLQGPDI